MFIRWIIINTFSDSPWSPLPLQFHKTNNFKCLNENTYLVKIREPFSYIPTAVLDAWILNNRIEPQNRYKWVMITHLNSLTNFPMNLELSTNNVQLSQGDSRMGWEENIIPYKVFTGKGVIGMERGRVTRWSWNLVASLLWRALQL